MRLNKTITQSVNRPHIWGRFIFVLLCFFAIGMMNPELPKNNPPHLPLKRTTGRLYHVQVQVQNKKISSGWPLLPRTNWCRIQSFNLTNQKGDQLNYRIDRLQDSSQLKILTQNLEYFVNLDSYVFSSELDSIAASKIPWPNEWDESFRMYLEPSRFIQSKDPIFKRAVEKNGNPRSVPIHIAAKILIRYCLQKIESNGQYSRNTGKTTTGIDVRGALHAINERKGSATDLVCVCIATLRAAGIPARPVLGITNANAVGTKKVNPQYMVWGEYALPNAGWVPFVPKRMRGTVNNLTPTEPWQGLGTLPWLNRRIPLSYNLNMYDIHRATQYISQMTFLSSPQ